MDLDSLGVVLVFGLGLWVVFTVYKALSFAIKDSPAVDSHVMRFTDLGLPPAEDPRWQEFAAGLKLESIMIYGGNVAIDGVIVHSSDHVKEFERSVLACIYAKKREKALEALEAFKAREKGEKGPFRS